MRWQWHNGIGCCLKQIESFRYPPNIYRNYFSCLFFSGHFIGDQCQENEGKPQYCQQIYEMVNVYLKKTVRRETSIHCKWWSRCANEWLKRYTTRRRESKDKGGEKIKTGSISIFFFSSRTWAGACWSCCQIPILVCSGGRCMQSGICRNTYIIVCEDASHTICWCIM